MPSGKAHDAITLMLAAPAFAITFAAARDLSASLVVAAGFIFGGMMFGPDLDTVSRQYSRWRAFSFIWLPYRRFFKHRSRFSHGLLFGALGRVIYFMGILTLTMFFASYAYAVYSNGKLPNLLEIASIWQPVGAFMRTNFGKHFMPAVFAGLWLGAASHTFTDMAGSFVKTGRIAKFL